MEDPQNNNELINSLFNNLNITTKQSDNRKTDFTHINSLMTEKHEDDYLSPCISRATATRAPKNIGINQQHAIVQENTLCETSTEPFCHVKLDSIVKLKDSTKKLLYLVQEIQSKSHSKHPFCGLPKSFIPNRTVEPTSSTDIEKSVPELSSALERLEIQTNILDTIPTAHDDDDCSIFNKLTRKCNCLNQREYNDFVIQFNEGTKFNTSTAGEIIKNLRILKKFLYMGGDYAKHALLFLNEGLGQSSYTEKIEIVQGCSHADMCNVFEDISLVITCIAWPYKYDTYGDTVTQELAAEFIHKLAQVEEGRRYLKFTSKITNDIRKVLKKKGSKLQAKTLEFLYSTLHKMHAQIDYTENSSFNSKPVNEGFGSQTMKALIFNKQHFTLCEILTHLDLLYKWSVVEKGKIELKSYLKTLLELFKDLLVTYDDSEINILIANILNNLISKNMLEEKEQVVPKIVTIADTSTEAIPMRNEAVQNSTKKRTIKKHIRTKRPSEKSNIIIVPLEK